MSKVRTSHSKRFLNLISLSTALWSMNSLITPKSNLRSRKVCRKSSEFGRKTLLPILTSVKKDLRPTMKNSTRSTLPRISYNLLKIIPPSLQTWNHLPTTNNSTKRLTFGRTILQASQKLLNFSSKFRVSGNILKASLRVNQIFPNSL